MSIHCIPITRIMYYNNIIQVINEQKYDFGYEMQQSQSKYYNYVSGHISEPDQCHYFFCSCIAYLPNLKYRNLFPMTRRNLIGNQLLKRMHYTANYHRIRLRTSSEILSGQFIIIIVILCITQLWQV